MNRRVLDVDASTTLDLVDGAARGPGWTDEGVAVVDVRTPRHDPDLVAVDLELDPTTLDTVAGHADSVYLTSDQAHALAAALEDAAETTELDAGRRRGR